MRQRIKKETQSRFYLESRIYLRKMKMLNYMFCHSINSVKVLSTNNGKIVSAALLRICLQSRSALRYNHDVKSLPATVHHSIGKRVTGIHDVSISRVLHRGVTCGTNKRLFFYATQASS